MVNIHMEESCLGEMHQVRRCSVERERCPLSPGDQKGIRHLIWLSRLIILILLLVCSVLGMLLYTMHYSVSKQYFPPQDNRMGGSAQKQQQQQQINANPNALLTAPNSVPSNSEACIQWEYDHGNAHLGDFKSNGTDLIVPRDGTYRIYLQITYRSFKKIDGLAGLGVSFYLFKFGMAYQRDVILLSCHDTVDMEFRKSLYTAATFKLKLNDRLRVKTTRPELMVLSEDTTFWGADLIS